MSDFTPFIYPFASIFLLYSGFAKLALNNYPAMDILHNLVMSCLPYLTLPCHAMTCPAPIHGDISILVFILSLEFNHFHIIMSPQHTGQGCGIQHCGRQRSYTTRGTYGTQYSHSTPHNTALHYTAPHNTALHTRMIFIRTHYTMCLLPFFLPFCRSMQQLR